MPRVARRRRIAELLRRRTIANQQELVERLSATGEHVTQATVSRDLRALGVAKGPSGYLLPENGAASPADVEEIRLNVLSIAVAGSLVVIRTPVGHANGVGVALDRLRPAGMVGCIAGDDTVFIATAGRDAARRLRRELAGHFDLDLAD
jgi:transcriptional regulator of arginine metabolism